MRIIAAPEADTLCYRNLATFHSLEAKTLTHLHNWIYMYIYMQAYTYTHIKKKMSAIKYYYFYNYFQLKLASHPTQTAYIISPSSKNKRTHIHSDPKAAKKKPVLGSGRQLASRSCCCCCCFLDHHILSSVLLLLFFPHQLIGNWTRQQQQQNASLPTSAIFLSLRRLPFPFGSNGSDKRLLRLVG